MNGHLTSIMTKFDKECPPEIFHYSEKPTMSILNACFYGEKSEDVFLVRLRKDFAEIKLETLRKTMRADRQLTEP